MMMGTDKIHRWTQTLLGKGCRRNRICIVSWCPPADTYCYKGEDSNSGDTGGYQPSLVSKGSITSKKDILIPCLEH
jgi:hypothetical protein